MGKEVRQTLYEIFNYTNQYLNSIGNQLDKIEEKLDNKHLAKEKHKPF
jgi:hypothetical protein